MTIRIYTPADFSTVEQWAQSRGIVLLPPLLSPNGFLVEDDGPLLVAFAYLMFDCPIVQIDHLLGRPGANIGRVREAWQMMQGALVEWVKGINEASGYNYRIFRCFTSPEIAREAAKNGWLIDSQPLKCCRYAF